MQEAWNILMPTMRYFFFLKFLECTRCQWLDVKHPRARTEDGEKIKIVDTISI